MNVLLGQMLASFILFIDWTIYTLSCIKETLNSFLYLIWYVDTKMTQVADIILRRKR